MREDEIPAQNASPFSGKPTAVSGMRKIDSGVGLQFLSAIYTDGPRSRGALGGEKMNFSVSSYLRGVVEVKAEVG